MTHVDRAAWRRFFLALFGLGMAFFLALYSTALREAGHTEGAMVAASLSLLIAAIVAIKVVPYLAKRTALERWMIKVEYEFTREGVAYFLIIMVIAIAALNTGNNLLFIILANLLAGILLSGILSAIVLSQLELDFALPEHVFAERPLISRLTVQNLKWVFPSFSLTLSARDPAEGQAQEDFPGRAAPDSGRSRLRALHPAPVRRDPARGAHLPSPRTLYAGRISRQHQVPLRPSAEGA